MLFAVPEVAWGAGPERRAPPSVQTDGGELLEAVERENALVRQMVAGEVEQLVRAARDEMQEHPLAVERALKLFMERVQRTPGLDGAARAELRAPLEAAARAANALAATRDAVEEQAGRARAARDAQRRVAEGLTRDEQRVGQLIDRFTSLMEEGRYTAADGMATADLREMAGGRAVSAAAAEVARHTGAALANLERRRARQKAVIDALAPVEFSFTPFADDEPFVMPDAETWEALSLRRRPYATQSDLKRDTAAEARIRAELEEPTAVSVEAMPLEDVVDYLKDLHGVEIQLDARALDEAGIGSAEPITIDTKGISLRSALRLMLRQLDLTYVVKDEVILITSTDEAAAELVTKVYPVSDLVIPISSTALPVGLGNSTSSMINGPPSPAANGPNNAAPAFAPPGRRNGPGNRF
jgi:hypothetical protein